MKNVAEGVRKLEAAHATLSATEQAEDSSAVPPGLENLAKGLMHPNILFSKSEDIQLLCCCCLVDVLRLYAPDAPYDDKEKLVRE